MKKLEESFEKEGSQEGNAFQIPFEKKYLLELLNYTVYNKSTVNGRCKKEVTIRFAMCFLDVFRTHLISSTENNI